MVGISLTNRRGQDALTRVKELVEQHGSDEHKARLQRIMGGAVPAPNQKPIEYATFTSEALVVLFEIVGPLVEASKPKKRGRPPKKQAAEAKEQAKVKES